MPANVAVKLDTSKLHQLARSFGGNADKAVEAVATQAVGDIQAVMTEKNIIDTGAGRASIHVEEKQRECQRTVADGTDYLIYHEFGTYKMSARPFMLEGALRACKGFAKSVTEWCFK